MTTLPQTTTSIRLPRPAGNGHMTAPGQTLPSFGGANASAGGMTGNDIWRVLRGNIWIILGVVICAGVLGYVANYYLAKNYPSYTATGLIEVNPISVANTDMLANANAQADGASVFLEQKTQAALLISESLLRKVLQNQSSEIRRTEWFLKFHDDLAAAYEDFKEHYTVTTVPESKLLKVEFSNTNPKETKTIVDEIVEQHIRDQQEVVLAMTQARSVELTQHLNRLRAKISTNEGMLGQYRAQLNDGGSGPGRVSIKEMELEQRIMLQTQLDIKLKDLQAEYDQLQQMIARGELPAEATDAIARDPQINSLRQQKINIEFEIAQMEDVVGTADKRLARLKKYLSKIDGQLADAEGEARLRAQNLALTKMQQAVSLAKSNAELEDHRVDDLKSGLGELSNIVAKYYTLMEEDKGLRDRAKVDNDQLDALMTRISNLGNKVQWRSRPVVPTLRSFPKLWMVMTVALLAGIALSVGLAFLREMTDTSIRSERDIARVGHMTLLGMVADESDDPQAAGARLPLVIFDAPHSMTAEQLRQVRTRLQHAASLDTTRSIMVTSAGPGDGKTTIACNLAAGLALNGRRILLVDANFRRPEIHKVFAVGNDQGFSDVLNSAVNFEDMVQETQVPNLAIMASGPKPINATEMFESQLLIDFIERALEEFDHVIFDSGPMMVVSESAAMAPRVDGVVTVVRARGSNRGQLQRMRDGLRATKAEHLGIVLNAVRAQGGGYYGRNIKTYYQYQNG